MDAVRFAFVIIFIMISVFMGFFSIQKLSFLPNTQYSLKNNYIKLAFYSSINAVCDIVFSVITLFWCGEGEFGTGWEVLSAMSVILLYAPPCIIVSARLKKRMPNYKKTSVKHVNALNTTIFFKAVFAFFATIFLVECCF